jgi:hypothetical protein
MNTHARRSTAATIALIASVKIKSALIIKIPFKELNYRKSAQLLSSQCTITLFLRNEPLCNTPVRDLQVASCYVPGSKYELLIRYRSTACQSLSDPSLAPIQL